MLLCIKLLRYMTYMTHVQVVTHLTLKRLQHLREQPDLCCWWHRLHQSAAACGAVVVCVQYCMQI
jgi:hypothetical protein